MNNKSPRKDVSFSKYWNSFVDDIENKKGFQLSHLKQLEVLCDLYVEYDVLSSIIIDQGYVDEVISKFGVSRKVSPYVIQRNKTVSEIRAYARLLGLLVPKEVVAPGEKESEAEENDDWES